MRHWRNERGASTRTRYGNAIGNDNNHSTGTSNGSAHSWPSTDALLDDLGAPAMNLARPAISLVLLLVLVGGLVSYKTTMSLGVVAGARATGTLHTRGDVISLESASPRLDPFARSINYFAVVWPALVFGILIGAAIRTFVSPRSLTGLLSRGRGRAQLTAGLAGSPLMLCSCCVAPIFSTVYERSARVGPSLAIMLAAPALNPAALTLTFMIFSPRIAWGRLLTSLVAVFLATPLIARIAEARPFAISNGRTASTRGADQTVSLPASFLRSCVHVTIRTVPLLVVGVVAGMFVADYVPAASLASSSIQIVTIAAVASIAVLLALPTFFELPLALALLTAGAPAGAAAALLFAGPAINLPSLLTIGRCAGWRVGALVGVAVWVLAFTGGLLVG